MPRLPRLKMQGLVDRWVNVNRECGAPLGFEEHPDDSVRSANSVHSAASTVRRRSSTTGGGHDEAAAAPPQQILQPPQQQQPDDAAPVSALNFRHLHSKSKLRKAEKKASAAATAASHDDVSVLKPKVAKQLGGSRPPKKSSRFRGGVTVTGPSRRRDRASNDDNLDDSEHARDNCKDGSARSATLPQDDEATVASVTSARTARTASSGLTASTYATHISSQVIFGPGISVVTASEDAADDVSVAVSTASSHSKRRKQQRERHAARAAQAQAHAEQAQALSRANAQVRQLQAQATAAGYGGPPAAPLPVVGAPAPLFHPHCQPALPTPGPYHPGVCEVSPGVIFSPMGDGAVPCFPDGAPFPPPQAPPAVSTAAIQNVVPGFPGVVMPAPSFAQAPRGYASPPPPVAIAALSPPPAAAAPPLPGTIMMEHNDWGRVDSLAPPEVVMPPPPPPHAAHQQQQAQFAATALPPPPPQVSSVMHIDHRRWNAQSSSASMMSPGPAAVAAPHQPPPVSAPPLAPYPPLPPHLTPSSPVVGLAAQKHHQPRPVAATAGHGLVVKSSEEVAMQALAQYRRRSSGPAHRPRVESVQAAGIFRGGEAQAHQAQAHHVQAKTSWLPPASSSAASNNPIWSRPAHGAAHEVDSDDETDDGSVEIEARMRRGLDLSSGDIGGQDRPPAQQQQEAPPPPQALPRQQQGQGSASASTSAEERMLEAAVILSTQLRRLSS